jgi:hypothetical protein
LAKEEFFSAKSWIVSQFTAQATIMAAENVWNYLIDCGAIGIENGNVFKGRLSASVKKNTIF